MVHAFLCKQAPRGAADPTSAPAPAPPTPPPQGGLPSARALTDGLAEREALALAGDDDDDLARVEDGADADGERHARDGGDVVREEARVGEDGVVRERLDARARGERRAGLVERDVPVLADPAEEELDPAVRADARLVARALADEVARVAVEDVDLGGRDVDCADRGEGEGWLRGWACVEERAWAHRGRRTRGT